MENENRESELSLIKEVASLTTEVKFLREDMSEMKKDVRRLLDNMPNACKDCVVSKDLERYIKEQKVKEEEERETTKFRWDIFAICSALVISFGTLVYTIIHDNRPVATQNIEQTAPSSIYRQH